LTSWVMRIIAYLQFHTYRTPDNPRVQITGLISDRTHTVPVEFDVDETDAFERYVLREIQLTAVRIPTSNPKV